MKYDDCGLCGGKVRERCVTVDLRRKDRLYIFYNVPVGVCSKCGERYYRGPVLEQLDQLAQHGMPGSKKLSVPTLNYSAA